MSYPLSGKLTGGGFDVALRTRNILSLCSGVGGLELGILLALHHRGEAGRGICYVEREASAAASLVASMEAGWFHPAPVWSDLATFDARAWRGHVHILASGDPCQENSVAGKRAGAAGKRFLAPEVCRIADECRPDLIFRENVPGNLAEQLDALAPPLERLGYRVAAGIFSSSATGNTMRRERAFVMAVRGGCAGWLGAGPEWEHLSDAGRRGAGVDGSERAERRPHGQPCGDGGQHGLSQRQEGPDRAGASGLDLAGPSGEGSQGHELGGSPAGQHRIAASRSTAELRGTRLPPAVIPGPADTRGWIDVLDRWPELQPALSEEEAQSHLRRGIDAMAHRVERLRATGNGVDPITAADAFLSLSGRLAE